MLATFQSVGAGQVNNVLLPDGTQVFAPSFTYRDVYGNQELIASGGADTLGRVMLTEVDNPGQTIYYVKDSTGTQQAYTVNYQNLNINTAFNMPSIYANAGNVHEYTGTRQVISSIELPNGLFYRFQYDNYASLTEIDLPTGAVVKYAWSNDPLQRVRYVTSRTVTIDGTSSTWTFGRGAGTAAECSPNNACNKYTVTDPQQNQSVFCESTPGKTYKVSTYQGSASGTPLREYDIAFWSNDSDEIVLPTSITTKLENGQVRKKEFTYDLASFNNTQCVAAEPYQCAQDPTLIQNVGIQTPRGNVLTIQEYDWGTGSPGPLLRTTTNKYLDVVADNPSTAAQYAAQNIVGKIIRQTITDSAGHTAADTQYEYDNNTTTGPFLGSATKVKRWRNTDGAWLGTSYSYDAFGNITSIADPLQHQTTWSYDDNWANQSCLPSGNSHAYVTQVTNALNQRVQLTRYPCTGQVQARKDENDIQAARNGTTFTYDLMNRPLVTNFPDGGQTSLDYHADALPLTTTKTVLATPDPSIVSSIVYDGMGRVHKTSLDSDPQGKIYTRIDYDGLGRQFLVWNPTRCDPDVVSSCPSESTWGITQTAYDALGRVTSVTNPDGSVVGTSYTGRATKVTDEGNGSYQVQRISHADGLGRVVSVCEVSGTTQSGSNNAPTPCNLDISGSGFLTTYQYDTLGNLTRASQVGMVDRTFTYDSLSRLICASNPEISNTAMCPNPDTGIYTAGTIRYSYDAAGNLVTKISPKPNQTDPSVTVTTTFSVDALNRIYQKQYSDLTPTSGTPTVHIDYDVSSDLGLSNLNNTVGRIAGEYVTDGNGQKLAGSVFSYDPVGRPRINSQCTPQNCPSSGFFGIAYTYDLAGGMNTASNGEGVTLSYAYDAAGRISSVTSSLVDANHPATLFSNTSYGPIGLTQATLGNGLTESRAYHQRGWLQSKLVTNLAGGQPGSGSVTLIGTLQSQTQPAIRATAQVSISGFNQSSTTIPPCPPPPMECDQTPVTTYDSGTVYITINGHEYDYFYPVNANGDSAADVAQGLVNAIQGDSVRVVNASVPPGGTVITLTAVNAGTGGNSIFFSTGSSYDTADFSAPSFTVGPGSGNLGGGKDSVTNYDSGSTTISVNNHPDSYPWSGSATTAASIVQGLCNAINADTAAFIYASTNGTPPQCPLGSTSVTFVSKQNGVSTDYTLSASSSSAMNSFTTSTSGAALTGGANPSSVYSFSLNFDPDGDIQSANDSVNGNWNYTYDDMNRLYTAVANNGNGCIESYDRYGNRWSQQPYGTGNSCGGSNLSFTGNNTTNNNRMDGYSYDAAGNLLNDGLGHSFTHDAESRIVSVSGTSTYTYDAEGRRVRRATPSGTVDYLYDLAGHAITEASSSGGWNRGEIYTGSAHLGSYDLGTTYFTHADWLGTERMRTQMNGTTFSTWTSLPFGEGSSTPNPSPLHFTGKERDAETGLDLMGLRYYGSPLGRFTTPDPEFASPDRIADPQQWNMYAYARNNPLSITDPTGLDFNLTCSGGNTATCQNGIQGQTTTDANGKSTFTATDVDMNDSKDASAGYHDQFGNQYTGSFDQNNGVSFTNTATGTTSSNSRFIDGSDETDVNGSTKGAFNGIQGRFNSNCGGSCEAKGSLYDLPGHPNAVSDLEKKIGKSLEDNLNFFGGHGKADNYRFGAGQLTHIVNHLGGLDKGKQEVHFEGHAPGRNLQNFVLHQVDAIRDAANHQSSQEPRLP